jgi:hypothetical protein
MPRYLSRSENPDELLATIILDSAGFGNRVVRFCIPTEATCDPAERNMVLVDGGEVGGADIVGVEVLLEKGTFLVSNRVPTGRIWECPLDITTTMSIFSCDLFAFRPEGLDWDP